VEVSEQQIADWYTANEASFMTEESVELEYIELRADDFREPVAEDVLREQFELTKEEYQYQTENRVSHILFEQGDDEADDAFQARIAAAQQALDDGRAFAELAGEISADIGSAAGGGDLGFSSGDAFPPEMEEAIAALEPGEISAPVTTDAGVHLILLTERRAGESISFEELRPELEQTIQLSEARGALLRSVEDLRDLAFNAEDLAGPAEELGLTLSSAEGITRNHAEGLFSDARLAAAAYSDDVLNQGHNSEVIELSPEHFVALRVKRYSEPELRPLEAVRDEIVAAITEQAARDAVQVEVRRAMAEIAAGNATVESFAVENGYEWQVEIGADRRNANLPEPVLRRAFELAAPGDAPVLDYVVNITGDVQLLELVRVSEGRLDSLGDVQRGVLQRQVSGEYGTLVQQEYQSGLREAADITIL
jgi:peptidyl-prolyl cis-trans isomerase D